MTRRVASPAGRAALLAAALVVALVVAGCSATAASPVTVAQPTGPTKPLSTTGIAGWAPAGNYTENTLDAGEGVASVVRSGKPTTLIYRGLRSIPKSLSGEGWGHIGDPDSMAGDIFDAYQGPSSGHSKMFLVTTGAGTTLQYVHTLIAGELYNNSFDAISPNGQWMVAGEWGTMNHLQIYPTPYLNHSTPRKGGALPLAGEIHLNHRVNDIQGCDFISAVTLICASDDDSGKLFTNQKPLLEVVLPHALGDAGVTGQVTDLGSIPQRSTCTGTFEAEGVDFDGGTGVLRVEIIQPGSCILKTTVDEYKQTHR
jgi:hypothetical protein